MKYPRVFSMTVMLSWILVLPGFAVAAAAAAEPAPAASKVEPVFTLPADLRPLKIAIYEGPGAGGNGVPNVTKHAGRMPGTTVTKLTPEEVGTRDLSEFDVIVFSGGGGSAQSKAIGEAGRRNVRQFVERGGGYLGICAGAYLACAGFDWGLGILDAKTVSNKWQRGRETVQLELSEQGRELFGEVKGRFPVSYANGPIIKPLGRADLPDYEVEAFFRTEVAKNGTPVGVMIDSPAIVRAPFGKGRVLTISPHPEATPGLENVVPRALAWLGEKR